jgi:hypothetical protein
VTTTLALMMLWASVWLAYHQARRARRAALLAFFYAMEGKWIEGMGVRRMFGWGSIDMVRELEDDGLVESITYGTPGQLRVRGGRPKVAYRCRPLAEIQGEPA